MGPERVLAAQVEGSGSRAFTELAHPCRFPGIEDPPWPNNLLRYLLLETHRSGVRHCLPPSKGLMADP